MQLAEASGSAGLKERQLDPMLIKWPHCNLNSYGYGKA